MSRAATKAFYHPELDVVRFVAFLAVFLSHGLPAGSTVTVLGASVRAFSLGLPLFFCLSAFLITKLLLIERHRTGSVDLPKFYKRRLLRIWPLYLITLAISATISGLHQTLHITWRWYVAALFMLGNTVWWVRTTVTHLWSISVEEQFYVFWPALVRRASETFLLRFVCGTFLASNLMLVWFGLIHAPLDSRIWANTVVQSEFFAVGMLLALKYQSRDRLNAFSRLLLFSVALFSFFCAVYKMHAFGNVGEVAAGPARLCLGYAFAALGCFLTMRAFLGTTGWPAPLIYLGKISYGLYVFHGVSLTVSQHYLLRFGRLPSLLASLCMNVVIAACSYHFFEARFLRWKQRYEVVSSRPIGH